LNGCEDFASDCPSCGEALHEGLSFCEEHYFAPGRELFRAAHDPEGDCFCSEDCARQAEEQKAQEEEEENSIQK
jgi:hypothetical protein